MIAYILFDNNFYKETIIDKTILEYLLEDLKGIGINKIVGVKYGLDVNVNGICEYINFNDLDKINEKSLLISSNVFFLNKENFKKNINKIMQKHEKKLIISNNYGNKYHNIYGILNKEGHLIRKMTLNGFYFVNDFKTLSFFEDEILVAIMDLIIDYPIKNTAFIGFFMIDVMYQNKCIGTNIINEVKCYLKELNYEKIRLGVDKENQQSYNFWLKNKFNSVNEDKYIVMECII